MYTGLHRQMLPGMGFISPARRKAGTPVVPPKRDPEAPEPPRKGWTSTAKAVDEATMDLGPLPDMYLGPMPDMDFTSGKGPNKTLLIAGGLGVAALAAAFLLMD